MKGVFNMWESFKEIWPQSFLKITFFLILYGLFCGVRMVLKDEKKRRAEKKRKEKGDK